MAQSPSLSLLEALSIVPDPRRRQGTRHPLPAVLTLLSVAFLCGYHTVSAALQWAQEHGQDLIRQLGLEKHGVPSGGMISMLLRRLDVAAVESALSAWAAAWPAELTEATQEQTHPADVPDVLSIDGKTLRGSRAHGMPGVHLLSAFAAKLGRVLKQVPAGANKEEGGEITAVPKLLEGLVLQGRIVTGDALHAQRNTCRIVVDGGGDYLLTVKENQPRLYNELVDLFRSPCAPFLSTATPTSTPPASSDARSR
jgi:hypothetical protein